MRRRISAPNRRTTATPRREQDVTDPETRRAMRFVLILREIFGEDTIGDFALPQTNPTTDNTEEETR